MIINKLKIGYALILVVSFATIFLACKDEEVYPETRLFRPVLNEELKAVNNSIIVNMAKLKEAVAYTIEISRDTFKTIDYSIKVDSNYVVINDELLKGDPLFWNMLYQVRSIAHAEEAEFDSKFSDLGSVRTERFPTILNAPSPYDVTDVEARVSWTVDADEVTETKVFAKSDLKLTTPLLEFNVPDADQISGETFVVQGLTPSTAYQIAIYSSGVLRGWVDYTTLIPDLDPTAPGVIDLRAATDPQAVATAVAGAASGDIILLKKGAKFNMPTVALNKSITIQSAYGLGEKKAQLFNTNGNWNIAGGSTIDHIRFIDLELRGGNFGGTYVFNPASDNINVREISFENCYINTMRGVMRLRNNNVVIQNYKFLNSRLDSIGGYGLITCDQASSPTTARINNIVLENSTFNHFQLFISTYNNMQSIVIESCTFSNVITSESTSNYLIRFRGTAGNNNAINGISIRNSIFGPGWNTGGTATNNIRGKEGLASTPIEVINTYGTNDWAFIAPYEIAGLPSAVYAGGKNSLWVDPEHSNFNFKDLTFAGKYSAGDPRWRIKL